MSETATSTTVSVAKELGVAAVKGAAMSAAQIAGAVVILAATGIVFEKVQARKAKKLAAATAE